MRYRGTQPSPFTAPPAPPPPEPEPEPERPPRAYHPPLTWNQRMLIIRLAAKGMRPAQIARTTGAHHKTVARVLREAGKLPPQSGQGGRPRALTPQQAREAAGRKAAGETWPAIANSYGASVTTVKRAIQRLG